MKNKNLEEFLLMWLFGNFYSKTTLITKIMPGFWQNAAKWTQPTWSWPKSWPWGLTRLNPILDPEGLTGPKKGSGLNRVFKVHYRVEIKFEPFLRSTWPDWTRSGMRANLTRLNQKIGLNPKKWVEFGRTDWGGFKWMDCRRCRFRHQRLH